MDNETIEHVAMLARLKLNPEEIESLRDDLNQILSHVDQLSELDTENVEPLAHPGDITNALRDDVTHQSTPREELLKNAPRQNGEYYQVPAVLGDTSSS